VEARRTQRPRAAKCHGCTDVARVQESGRTQAAARALREPICCKTATWRSGATPAAFASARRRRVPPDRVRPPPIPVPARASLTNASYCTQPCVIGPSRSRSATTRPVRSAPVEPTVFAACRQRPPSRETSATARRSARRLLTAPTGRTRAAPAIRRSNRSRVTASAAGPDPTWLAQAEQNPS
jgi:hypothetical protein